MDDLIIIDTTDIPFWTRFDPSKAMLSTFTHEGYLMIDYKGTMKPFWFCLSHDILAFKSTPNSSELLYFTTI